MQSGEPVTSAEAPIWSLLRSVMDSMCGSNASASKTVLERKKWGRVTEVNARDFDKKFVKCVVYSPTGRGISRENVWS